MGQKMLLNYKIKNWTETGFPAVSPKFLLLFTPDRRLHADMILHFPIHGPGVNCNTFSLRFSA